MKISIIIPIYKGNQYIDNIIDMIQKNVKNLEKSRKEISVEVLFVNDSPDIDLISPKINYKYDFEIKVLKNLENQGIHQSRVNGLRNAAGDYVLMLDQDDKISNNFLDSQISKIRDADIVVGNGYKMIGTRKKIIYRNIKKQKLAAKQKIFLYAASQIVSPGQCLIRKEAIPKEWYEFIIINNGSDDLFLWLLMFKKQCKFAINPEIIYTHVDTGINLSLNSDKMFESSENLISLLKKSQIFSKKTIDIYERRIRFLKNIKTKSKIRKVIACLKNIDICIYKLYAYYR